MFTIALSDLFITECNILLHSYWIDWYLGAIFVVGSQKHVFISYQWDSKPTILMIRDRLKDEGFTIWVDVDNMCKYFIIQVLNQVFNLSQAASHSAAVLSLAFRYA